MRNKILVTGGLGYIGSHTVVALQKEGYDVIIIDDLSSSDKSFLDRIVELTGIMPDFHMIDLKNSDAVDQFFKKNKVEGIIHFAAHKFVGESVKNPLKYYHNNLFGLINVLTAMEEYNVDNFIFSSSCTVYGQADKMPVDEKTPLKNPESPYGKTKKMGEEIIEDFVKASGKNAVSLRYFNPVGSESKGLLGDLQPIPNNLVPYIVQTAAGVRESLGIYGNNYETRDGTAIRDYIDVNDLADAHVKALKRLFDKQNETNLEYFNLGSGTGSTVLEVIEAFEKANNLKINCCIQPRRPGDIQEAYADYTLAKIKLDWEPKIPLETSMKTAWEFQKKLLK